MSRALSAEELVAIRRDLHRHPELSHVESRTAGVVAQRLRTLGFEPTTGIAGHGVVAELVGQAGDGPTLVYRADMDALPILEANTHDYASQNPGVMHACGHDVHTTIGLGVAAALTDRRSELRGRVRFVFQPAEEAAPPPGQSIGAERMVEEGVLDGVDAAYALHVMPLLDVGRIGFTGGPVWAASDLFDIHVDGAMAHGAYPHEGRDPILAAAAIVSALQQVVSRIVDARDACVVSVCRVTAGTAYNIIPDAAHMQGLLRTLDPTVRDNAMERIRTIASQVAAGYGCSARVQFVRGTRLTANDPAVERDACEAIRTRARDIDVVPFRPQMGAEDFAAFSTRVPGCYLFLGIRNEARGITHPLHTPLFDVDERCLPIGVRSMTEALLAASAATVTS
ncbi:MAG: amidohydrolase [Myxococcales bacterium]|nr:amidohydrolase [Myxococcales bacterium]MCB9533932.1 amidohydrolase [Myxococcales bacterium]